MVETKDEEEGENEQNDQPREADESPEQKVNSFWDISYGVGEEEELDEVQMSQNTVTTRSARKMTSFHTPPSFPPKVASHTQNTIDDASKQVFLILLYQSWNMIYWNT